MYTYSYTHIPRHPSQGRRIWLLDIPSVIRDVPHRDRNHLKGLSPENGPKMSGETVGGDQDVSVDDDDDILGTPGDGTEHTDNRNLKNILWVMMTMKCSRMTVLKGVRIPP